MRKVLHIITSTQVGGAENHILALASALQERGWRSQVAYLKGRGDLDKEFSARGIPVQNLRLRRWLDPWALARLIRVIKHIRPDIVHAHLFPAEVYATLATLWPRPPAVICTKHNDEDFLQRLHFRALHRAISSRASRIIAISEHLRRYTVAIGVANPTRIVVIPYGYDPPDGVHADPITRDRLGVPPEAFLVGSVGRLASQKGHTHLLEAMRRLRAQGVDVWLAILGDGPLRDVLATQVREWGLDGRVRLLGHDPEAARLMGAFDVFAHPSLWEGFGLVLLEAMAAARPIVASRVSAIPEIVADGVTGLLVPPGDADALADAIRALSLDRSLRERMGKAGAERLRTHFSLEKMVERTEEVYRAVLSGRG